ncbi:MAG: hypothetical protein OEZ20_01640 [candidate division WOR-3 bacterium]|nr:hypothetical protein [candidate division WOR-3 bacterium]MDH5683154.1 hypothetical protein [candidate division WOR-3 bacterium]
MENWASLLKEIAKKARIIAKRLESFKKIKEQPVANIHILEKSLNAVKKVLNTFPDSGIKSGLLKWAEEEADFIKKTKEEFRFQFGNQLKELLEKDGLTLKGQMPLLRTGFYTLKFNFDLGFASFYWGPEIQIIKAKIPLSVQEIYKTLYKFNEQIKKRTLPPHDFLKNLHQAYHRFISFNNITNGNKVLLIDLLSELVLISQPASFRADPSKETFREYSRIQFSYDLYNLKKSEKFEVGKNKLRLSVATFDATTDKTKSLWVPDNENGDGTYYSYIAFEEKKE